MAELPWNRFLEIPGDPRHRFEVLCREVVRRHYEGLGPLLTRKQQPGVEFHLRLEHADPALGEVGRHWGWQCRWYEPDDFYSDDSRLLQPRRKKIEEAIAKSAEHVKGLTDWVLWTRAKLSADDERWFEGLEAPFTLHRWDEETLAGLLSGGAEILRRTWFGDLVLDRAALQEARRLALAPIAHRYEAELHVRTPPEKKLGRVLPGPGLARAIAGHKASLERAASELRAGEEPEGLEGHTAAALQSATGALGEIEAGLGEQRLPSPDELRAAALDDSELEALRKEIKARVEAEEDPGGRLGRSLEALGSAQKLLKRTADDLGLGLVVILGGAGSGKTHLAAHLSGPDEEPAGILLIGRQFGEKITEDEIAGAAGFDVGIERLLEALEAIGLREGRRVPMVIDGINESDEPAAWKDALARLRTRLERFRHVLCLVTVRPSYSKFALPVESKGFRLEGLTGVEAASVRRYFAHYKIHADQEAIDWWRPSDPLLLAIFCRTVNGERKETVDAAELPRSLTEVFEAYIDDAATRIAVTMGLDPEQIITPLDALAERLFDAGARELQREEAAEVLGDQARAPRKELLRFQLESEEVLVRDVVEGGEKVAFGYDLLAGHLIARDLLARRSPTEIGSGALAGRIAAHPLAEDIVTGLTGLLGARGLEPSASLGGGSPLGAQIAIAAARLPGAQIGPETVAGIEAIFAARPEEALEAIAPWALRPGHPLNATLLDRLLGDLETWRRDLTWSEWVRARSETIMVEVVGIERRLEEGRDLEDPEAALAWLTWLLTSTDKALRDTVTKALYRLGRRHPELLFERALAWLAVTDPQVAEGLLAASYGVAMASQEPGAPAREAVIAFAAELGARLIGQGAREPTRHWLIREYAYRTLQLADRLSGGQLGAPGAAAQPPLPAPPGALRYFRPDSARWEAVDGAFGMDFENYTIGRLVEGRSNYDFDHQGFRRVTGQVRARIAELGWTEARFLKIDRAIAQDSYSRMNDPEKVERYGKKYGWVGFYEAAGQLSDEGKLHGEGAGFGGWRISEVPLDPSFPQSIPMPETELPVWSSEEGSDEEWARHGETEIPDGLLRREFDGRSWVAIDGYVAHEPYGSQRKVFCFIRGLMALEGWASIEAYVEEHPVEAELVPGNAAEYYCFAGETPWSATFDSWATAADGSEKAETRPLGWRHEDGPEIELLAVDFNWEGYHSILNDAEIGSLPSKAFSRATGLAKLPDRAEFVDETGELAAQALAVRQEGWRGHLLYAREDLLADYCRQRGGEWGWICWGDREVHTPEAVTFSELPAWIGEVRRQGLDRFSRMVSLDELKRAEEPHAS